MAEPSGILIKGGKVVNEDYSAISDVYIEHGKIVDVGLDLQVPEGVRVIDATDKLVIPGGIDTHTHMELAFMGTQAVDDFHIGTKVNPMLLLLLLFFVDTASDRRGSQEMFKCIKLDWKLRNNPALSSSLIYRIKMFQNV